MMTDNFGTSLASSLHASNVTTAVTGAAAVIRYSFYLFGAIVFGLIGLGTLTAWNARVVHIDVPPAFHLASPHLARLPVTGEVIGSGPFGRAEIRHYGHLYNRDVDLTIALIMPRKMTPLLRELGQQVRDIRPMRNARAMFGSTYFDIETRFGSVRATDLRVDSDGQWKQCLAFLSRFDTLSVYFTGWYCDASGAKPSAERLACMLDRLTLDKDLASKEAEAFLRERIARPGSCSATPVSQTTDTRARSRVSPPQNWSIPNANRR